MAPNNPLFPGSYGQQKIIEGAANEVRTAENTSEQPNAILNGMVDLANATSESFGAGWFTGLDRRDNDILMRDALLGAIGIKLRPVRIDQLAESKFYEINTAQQALGKWMSRHERDYAEGRIPKAQIEKYRQQYEAANKEFSGRIIPM